VNWAVLWLLDAESLDNFAIFGSNLGLSLCALPIFYGFAFTSISRGRWLGDTNMLQSSMLEF
jgi:hypothetical protein